MYITINDIIGEKRIDLSYLIHPRKEVAVVSMLSNNVQYWLQGSEEVLLKTGKKIVLNKGVYTDRELNSLIGLEMKSQMLDSCNDVLRTNKLEKVTKMVFSLNELDNSDNLEDGNPSNTLFTYYVTGPGYSTCFQPHTPQYKKLKNDKITFLTMKMKNEMIGMKPKDAIKLYQVLLVNRENYPPEDKLPEDGLYRYLLQTGENMMTNGAEQRIEYGLREHTD